MKVEVSIPSQSDLQNCYEKLQAAKSAATSLELVRMAQWSRFDPRLMQQLIEHFAKFWKEISPIPMNRTLLSVDWPQALGVVLEHVEFLLPGKSQSENQLFRSWKSLVMTNIPPIEWQNFFIGLSPLGSKRDRQAAAIPIKPFTRWGFLENELQIPKLSSWPDVFAVSTRQQILLQLLNQFEKISVEDYLAACKHSISPRQAQRDLAQFPGLRKRGVTKATRYLLSRHKQDLGPED